MQACLITEWASLSIDCRWVCIAVLQASIDRFTHVLEAQAFVQKETLGLLSEARPPAHTLSLAQVSSFDAKGSRHQSGRSLIAAQKRTKTFLTLPSTCWTSLRRTLKRTVLDRGRHWPTVTTSPVLIRKAGEQWTATLEWRFSNLLYFLM